MWTGNRRSGQSAKNTFPVPAPELPRSWPLFTLSGGRYVLQVADSMDGRISDGGQVLTISQLKGSGRIQKQGNAWVIPLSDAARGKISIGEMTLLFQFVIAPPIQPRPALPHSVRGSLADRIDPYLAVVLSVSLVAHMMVWGYFKYVVEEPKPHAPDVIPDQFARVVMERPKPPPTLADQRKPGPSEGEKEPAKEEPRKEPRASEEPRVADKSSGVPDRAAIAAKVEGAAPLRVLKQLGARGSGPLVGVSDKEGWEDLDKGLKNVGTGNVVASVGTGGQTTRGPGSGTIASGKEVGVTGPTGPAATGAEKVEKEVKISGRADKIVDIDSGGLDPGSVAATIRARYQSRVNACYQRALKENPNLGGDVELSFTIGIAGNVVRSGADGFDSGVDACIAREARTWRFAKPDSPAEFQIKFILRRAN